MIKLIAVPIIILFCGCASMPIIGPCSYVASKSNTPKLGTASGKGTLGRSVWEASKVTAGYAIDSFLWGLAIGYANDKLNEGKEDPDDGEDLRRMEKTDVIIISDSVCVYHLPIKENKE